MNKVWIFWQASLASRPAKRSEFLDLQSVLSSSKVGLCKVRELEASCTWWLWEGKLGIHWNMFSFLKLLMLCVIFALVSETTQMITHFSFLNTFLYMRSFLYVCLCRWMKIEPSKLHLLTMVILKTAKHQNYVRVFIWVIFQFSATNAS